MRLPEDDEEYLNGKGYDWQLAPDGGGGCLIIKGFSVSAEVFDAAKVDLMIRIPAGYNMAGLDMFYVDPPLRMRATGAYPEAASHFEQHTGRKWQRFSRHLITTRWRPGVDRLPMFLALIQKELQARG